MSPAPCRVRSARFRMRLVLLAVSLGCPVWAPASVPPLAATVRTVVGADARLAYCPRAAKRSQPREWKAKEWKNTGWKNTSWKDKGWKDTGWKDKGWDSNDWKVREWRPSRSR